MSNQKDRNQKNDLKSRQSKLLSPQAPGAKKLHHFNIDIAEYCDSLDAAIIFENLSSIINHNALYKKHYHKGRYWCYYTYQRLLEFCPYLKNEWRCKRAINTLIEYDLLLKDHFNRDPRDRTNWYGFTNFALSFFGNGHQKPNLSEINENIRVAKVAKEIFTNPEEYTSPTIEDLQMDAQSQVECHEANMPPQNSPQTQYSCHEANMPPQTREANMLALHIEQYVTNTTTVQPNVVELIKAVGSSMNLNNVSRSKEGNMDNFDFSALRKLMFCQKDLDELEMIYAHKLDILKSSITHLVFNLEVNNFQPRTTVQYYFMSIMRKGDGYREPPNYTKRNPSKEMPRPGIWVSQKDSNYKPTAKSKEQINELIQKGKDLLIKSSDV